MQVTPQDWVLTEVLMPASRRASLRVPADFSLLCTAAFQTHCVLIYPTRCWLAEKFLN